MNRTFAYILPFLFALLSWGAQAQHSGEQPATPTHTQTQVSPAQGTATPAQATPTDAHTQQGAATMGHDAHATATQGGAHEAHGTAGGHADENSKPDLAGMIMNHVADAHEFHIGNITVPLPCIPYHKDRGFEVFLSSQLHHGHSAYNGYVSNHGVLNAVDDPSFPQGEVQDVHVHEDKASKKTIVEYQGKQYTASRASFFDFSITRVVFTMLLTALIMMLVFTTVAAGYAKRSVPSGIQSFFEPIILFVREDIAKPNLGAKYQKFMPYLLTIFFFIWISNVLGLIPFFPGGGNVMGNIAVTATLAIFTFLLINFNGNKAYWGHIFNPPGIPFAIKLLMVPIEVLSIFIKPFALMIRLFANILAGHIIILSLVGIIFIAAHVGGSAAGYGASIVSSLFMLFMNVLELFVAALQAYIFTTLSAVFIGQAIEDHSHGHDEAHH